MTTIVTRCEFSAPGQPRTSPGVARARRLARTLPALAVLGLALTLVAACGSGDITDAPGADGVVVPLAAELSPEAVEACQEVFARTDAPGTQLVVVWDVTASVADMPFPAGLAKDLTAASLSDGTLSIVAVEGEGVAPRILAKNVALSSTGERDRPSVAKLAGVMPSCVQAVYLNGLVPTAPGTDLHRAMAIGAEIAGPGAIVWTVSDMLSNSGQFDLTRAVLAQTADQAAKATVVDAPVDLHGNTWRVSGLANASTPLLSANREWLRDFTRAVCGGWNATGCADIGLDPVNPVRNTKGMPEDSIPPFPAVVAVSTSDGCTFTVPNDILFAGGSAELRGDVDEVLAKPIALLKAHPQATLKVIGHTASTNASAPAELLALSEERARAVRDRITHAGIDGARVTTEGVGDTEPLAEDLDLETGQQIPELAAAERRVELKIEGAPCSR